MGEVVVRGATDASIDQRTGGELSVTVRGVNDAQALADRFVAG